MRKLKKLVAGLWAALMIMCLPGEIMAASGGTTVNPGMITLQANRIYDVYDVTGDGVADEMLVESEHYDYFSSGKQGYLNIFVNGKNAFTLEDPYYKGDATRQYDIKLCTMNSREPFLFVRTCSETEYYNFCRLYSFQSGRFRPVLNLKNTYKNIFHHREKMDLVNVEGNRIQFQWYGQLGAAGALNWTVSYDFVNGEFNRISRTSPVSGKDKERDWTASREFSAYSTAGLKDIAFQVKEGDNLKVTHVYNNSKYAFIRIINSAGTAGWVPCPNTHSPYFKEAVYAG